MQQNRSQASSQGGRPSSVSVTSLALRGLGQVYDMNLAATRVMLQTQARAASVLGFPDWSGVFDQVDERARHVFSASAEQLVETTQRASEVASDLQRQVGRVVETQAATVAESLQHGLEELSTQANEGLKQLCDTARQQADEAERVAQTMSEEMRETLRQGGEQMRNAMRQGGEEVRGSLRQGGEQMSESMRQGGEESREAAQRGRAGDGSPHGEQQHSAGEEGSRTQGGGEDKAGRRGKGGPQQGASA
jgi:hypothetical protein